MGLWKINCMENEYPGMWQRWFRNQCVAVGWKSDWGYPLSGSGQFGRGWSRARRALQEIAVGDHIIVALSGHRVGRLGQVTGKAVDDTDWDPLVPKNSQLPDGEMGRRVFVRWDLTVGPDDREMVVLLPPEKQFTSGELRPTISVIQSISVDELKVVMNDPANWIGLLSHFDYERALSGYLAAYPHRLEDGLLPYPYEKVREKVFKDKSRLDVLLIDRSEVPVIVECKQGQPTSADIDQLRHYLRQLAAEIGRSARGILVHGGARKLRKEVEDYARSQPQIEIVQYRLEVDFSSSN